MAKIATKGGVHKSSWSDECLNWELHADLVASKISKLLVAIRGMKQVLLSADMENSIMHLYIPTLLMVFRYGVRQVNRS